MPAALPKEVQVFDLWPASVRFVLPRRHLAGGWIFCGALLVAGLVEIGLLLHLLHSVLGGPHFILGRAAAAILIVFGFLTLAGLLPLWWGLAGLFGHRELEITQERLRTVERVGPLWRSKRWKIAAIHCFDVVPITSGSSDEPDRSPPPAILEQFNALLVRLKGGQQGMLAWGYPAELLRPVAAELTARANAALERNGQQGDIQMLAKVPPPASEVGEETDFPDGDGNELDSDDFDDDEPANPAIQPENSPIVIDRFPDGLTIRVPPAGIRKGSSGLFSFSLLWNGFMTLFTVCSGYAIVSGQAKDFEDGEWIFAAVISLFWLVGIGMLAGAINMGRRQAVLAVTGGHLLAMQTGLFGKKQREWPASEIKRIAVGPSGMEMNEVPILELQIVDRLGKKLGILAGRNDNELHWLAHELTQAVEAAQAAARG